jgi:ABC-type amino acid transport substrate-binding protein
MKIDSDKAFFDDNGENYDALLISLEAGKTWTLLRPEYTTVYRRDSISSFPASYAVALGNAELRDFFNSWLELKRSAGRIEQLYDYWIQGKNAVPKTPRWSIMRDVLGWGVEDP